MRHKLSSPRFGLSASLMNSTRNLRGDDTHETIDPLARLSVLR